MLLIIRHARLAGGCIMFSTCPFVRPSVRSSVTKLVKTIFWRKNNAPILTPTGTSGPSDKRMKRSTNLIKLLKLVCFNPPKNDLHLELVVLTRQFVVDFSPSYVATKQKAGICNSFQVIVWTHTQTSLPNASFACVHDRDVRPRGLASASRPIFSGLGLKQMASASASCGSRPRPRPKAV